MNTKPKVLLTASYGPNELLWGEDMFDLMASRLARGHGPFFPVTNHMHYAGLYLIAENITNPTTVLENPHWDEFDRELDEGYDVVGFQLKSIYMAKVARMMKRIREKCPKTKIVVGGYGVLTLSQPVPGDTNGDAVYIRENADYLCQEEGVGFMRKILDDGPIDREITQYHQPLCGMNLAGSKRIQANAATILVALGCPNACDFCCTSATFKHKKILVAEPEQVLKFIKHYQKRMKSKDIIVTLFDEDIFLDPEYVRELGRLLRKDRDTWGVKWFGFGSMRSLSQFEPEEIRDSGCGSIWIGVESFMCGQDQGDDKYGKRKGKGVEEMFADLHRHGVHTVGSLVLGFDFHNRENIKEDIDKFVALKPMLYQLAPLTPCPGTEFYGRMLEEERIYDSFKWEDGHIWKYDTFKVKNFEKDELKNFYDYAHDQLRDVNGPPPLQIMESALDSYQLLKNKAEGSTDEFRDFQARQVRAMASGVFSYLRSVKLHHPSETVKTRARMLEKRYRDEIGDPPLLSRAASRYLSRRIKKDIDNPPPKTVSDPPPRWSYYNTIGDEVWVKKGRQTKRPEVYKDKASLMSLTKFIRGR